MGSRRALQVKNAATRLGLTDRHVTHRNVKLKRQARLGDSLVFLMIGGTPPMVACGSRRCCGASTSAGARSARRRLFAGMGEIAGELADGGQATSFYALDGGPLGKFITVHPLGGCPMADDPTRGVTPRPRARVRGLHVLDGSIVPTALGVNPSKTIAALWPSAVWRIS